MVYSFMMNSIICSQFSHLPNSGNKLSLDLLSSMLTFYLCVSTFKCFSSKESLQTFKNIKQASYKKICCKQAGFEPV